MSSAITTTMLGFVAAVGLGRGWRRRPGARWSRGAPAARVSGLRRRWSPRCRAIVEAWCVVLPRVRTTDHSLVSHYTFTRSHHLARTTAARSRAVRAGCPPSWVAPITRAPSIRRCSCSAARSGIGMPHRLELPNQECTNPPPVRVGFRMCRMVRIRKCQVGREVSTAPEARVSRRARRGDRTGREAGLGDRCRRPTRPRTTQDPRRWRGGAPPRPARPCRRSARRATCGPPSPPRAARPLRPRRRVCRRGSGPP